MLFSPQTALQSRGVDAGFAQECRDQLVKYCHVQMSYRADYEEVCAVYAKAVNQESFDAAVTTSSYN